MTDLTWTQKWIGAPFADKGRGPAYDCWGLLWAVLRVQFGVEVPSYPGVSGEMDNRDQVKELFEAPAELERWEEVPAGQERPGDGVLIRMRRRLPGGLPVLQVAEAYSWILPVEGRPCLIW